MSRSAHTSPSLSGNYRRLVSSLCDRGSGAPGHTSHFRRRTGKDWVGVGAWGVPWRGVVCRGVAWRGVLCCIVPCRCSHSKAFVNSTSCVFGQSRVKGGRTQSRQSLRHNRHPRRLTPKARFVFNLHSEGGGSRKTPPATLALLCPGTRQCHVAFSVWTAAMRPLEGQCPGPWCCVGNDLIICGPLLLHVRVAVCWTEVLPPERERGREGGECVGRHGGGDDAGRVAVPHQPEKDCCCGPSSKIRAHAATP